LLVGTNKKIIDFNFAVNYNYYFLLLESGENYISLFWCKLQTYFKKMVQITHVVHLVNSDDVQFQKFNIQYIL